MINSICLTGGPKDLCSIFLLDKIPMDDGNIWPRAITQAKVSTSSSLPRQAGLTFSQTGIIFTDNAITLDNYCVSVSAVQSVFFQNILAATTGRRIFTSYFSSNIPHLHGSASKNTFVNCSCEVTQSEYKSLRQVWPAHQSLGLTYTSCQKSGQLIVRQKITLAVRWYWRW